MKDRQDHEIPICSNCKHYTMFGNFPRCLLSPREPTRNWPTVECIDMRISGPCGEEGKLYEPNFPTRIIDWLIKKLGGTP